MNVRLVMIYVTGIALTYLGTSIVVKAAIGAGFWAALFVGLNQQTGLSVGIWFGLAQVILVVLNSFLRKTSMDWLAVIPIILESAFFAFWLDVVLRSVDFQGTSLALKIAIFLLGITIATIGIALYIQTNLTRSPVDELFLALSERLQWRISTTQITIATVITLLALLVQGPVGLGTIIAMLIYGPLIEYWNHIFQKRAPQEPSFYS